MKKPRDWPLRWDSTIGAWDIRKGLIVTEAWVQMKGLAGVSASEIRDKIEEEVNQ